jgi:hypothetical protein
MMISLRRPRRDEWAANKRLHVQPTQSFRLKSPIEGGEIRKFATDILWSDEIYHLRNLGINGGIIVTDHKEKGYQGVGWKQLAQDRVL